MKKIMIAIVICISIITLSSCIEAESSDIKQGGKQITDNISFKSGNLLTSFDKRLNEEYDAYVTVRRLHTNGKDSNIIRNYELEYNYSKNSDNNYIHNVYNPNINKYDNNTLSNIEVVIDNNSKFYFAADDDIKETHNIFKLDTFTGEYVSRFTNDTDIIKEQQFSVYQTVLCYDTLHKMVSRLKNSNLVCNKYDYNMNYGYEYYVTDDGRMEYELKLDDNGWTYKETDNLTKITYEYIIIFMDKG